jgi:hypothetical protein
MFLLYLIHFSDVPPLLAQLIVLIKTLSLGIRTHNLSGNRCRLMVFNATFNSICRRNVLNIAETYIFLGIRKFYYLNESDQVSCLSHNVNINVFGIFMCLTQLQTSFYNIYGWLSCNNSFPLTFTK